MKYMDNVCDAMHIEPGWVAPTLCLIESVYVLIMVMGDEIGI